MLSCRLKGETLTASPDDMRDTKDREQRKKPDIAGLISLFNYGILPIFIAEISALSFAYGRAFGKEFHG